MQSRYARVANGAKNWEPQFPRQMWFWCSGATTQTHRMKFGRSSRFAPARQGRLALAIGRNFVAQQTCRPSHHRLSCLYFGVMHEGSPDQEEPGDVAGRVEADRLIASDISRQYRGAAGNEPRKGKSKPSWPQGWDRSEVLRPEQWPSRIRAVMPWQVSRSGSARCGNSTIVASRCTSAPDGRGLEFLVAHPHRRVVLVFDIDLG